MKILLAVDGSAHSRDAVEAVKERPWPNGSTVQVLSAVPPMLPPPPMPAWAGESVGYKELQDRLKMDAQAVAERAAEALRDRGLACEPVVRMGDPRGEILDEAERWGADLIVLGSRGHSGLKRWILGSVAQHVVAHAPCSVEVVRARHIPPAAT